MTNLASITLPSCEMIFCWRNKRYETEGGIYAYESNPCCYFMGEYTANAFFFYVSSFSPVTASCSSFATLYWETDKILIYHLMRNRK